jgi:tetratricopeptide (TPR) repeat protein
MRYPMWVVLLAGVLTCWIGAVAADDQRIDKVPMYGQPAIPRPEFLKKADEDFIKEAVAGLGSREVASQTWFARAEQYMQKRDFDLAMRRYNQSWLLNPNNYQPYWGFGRVLLERGKYEEASQHLEKAKGLVDDQFQKVALLADLGTAYMVRASTAAKTDTAEANRLFALANQNFSESTSLDQTYSNGWRRWAMSLYEQGDYSQAWEKVREARARNARPFPPAFIRTLEQKLAEPR